MIVQNKVNVQWELGHKTDNSMVLDKHVKRRILVQNK